LLTVFFLYGCSRASGIQAWNGSNRDRHKPENVWNYLTGAGQVQASLVPTEETRGEFEMDKMSVPEFDYSHP
jgi:hypothetical protein